jgi:SAM-dependent methyltransferase
LAKLNVGCGEWPLEGYINLDADKGVHPDLLATVPPLPFEDGDLEEVYAGHFLEHLGLDEARDFLLECRRVLRPGGVLTLVVPDTLEVMRRYVAGSTDAVNVSGLWWGVADLDAVCSVFLYSPIQATPHRWSYDARTLRRAMAWAGFGELREIDRYRDPRLASGAWYQVGVEGVRA